MKRIFQLTLIILITTFFSACSNIQALVEKTSSSVASTNDSARNPLKSADDILIEKLIIGGVWVYQRQADDCNDTHWKQRFNANRYYQSLGDACQVPDSFSVEAETWHVKDQYLYIANLAPKEADDIVLRYKIEYLNKARMVLSSNNFQYTFLKQ